MSLIYKKINYFVWGGGGGGKNIGPAAARPADQFWCPYNVNITVVDPGFINIGFTCHASKYAQCALSNCTTVKVTIIMG